MFSKELRTRAIAKPLEVNELENGIKKSIVQVKVSRKIVSIAPFV